MPIKRTLTRLWVLLLFVSTGLQAQFNEEIIVADLSYFRDMVVGDIDGDGLKDIVTNEVQWYKQQADGTFALGISIDKNALKVHLVDLDGNGTLDVVYNSGYYSEKV